MVFKHVLWLTIALFMVESAAAQSIPAERRSDWERAGRAAPIPTYDLQVNMDDYGGIGDGTTANDIAFQQAVMALNGKPGVIAFGTGEYLFNKPVLLRDSLVLRGEGADKTTLLFDLGGSTPNCVVAKGTLDSDQLAVAVEQPVSVGDSVLFVTPVFQPGDLLRFQFDDEALIFSTWARGSAGQILEVKAVDADRIVVNHPMRFAVPLALQPRLRRVEPVEDAGLECLKIKRLDGNVPFGSNVWFGYARRCWLVGIESEKCNFAHFTLEGSAHCEVYGCYANDAFAYGGGGQGYGLVFQNTASDNRIQNNIFKKLRHAMLLQSGATGNVLAYNFSTEPTWVEFPNDAAGDIAIHGNYPSYNLFEGNVCKNIRPDGSHGQNGPYNTFFRNRATGYGIVFTAPEYQRSYNIAGNEVTGSGLFQGLYVVLGTDNWEQGNIQSGVIVPNGSSIQSDNSLYFNALPAFLKNTPYQIGPPAAFNSGIIPAQARFQFTAEKTDCDALNGMSPVSATNMPNMAPLQVYPNPIQGGAFRVALPDVPAEVFVFDVEGRCLFQQKSDMPDLLVPCANWPAGNYFLSVLSRGLVTSVVLLKS